MTMHVNKILDCWTYCRSFKFMPLTLYLLYSYLILWTLWTTSIKFVKFDLHIYDHDRIHQRPTSSYNRWTQRATLIRSRIIVWWWCRGRASTATDLPILTQPKVEAAKLACMRYEYAGRKLLLSIVTWYCIGKPIFSITLDDYSRMMRGLDSDKYQLSVSLFMHTCTAVFTAAVLCSSAA